MVGQQIKGTILGMMVALGASKYAYQPEETSQITINGNKELGLKGSDNVQAKTGA